MKNKSKVKLRQLLVLLLVVSMLMGDLGVIVASASSAKGVVKVEQKKEGASTKGVEVKDQVGSRDQEAADKAIKNIKGEINELGKLFDMAPSEDHYKIASSNAGKVKNMVDAIIKNIEDSNENSIITRDEAEELYEYLIGDTSSKDKNLFLYYIVDTIYRGYLAELQKLKENNIELNSVEQEEHEKKLEGLYELRDRLNQVFNNSPRRDELDEINKGYDDLDLKINDIYKEIIPGVTVGSVIDESLWEINFKRPKLKLRVLKNTKDGKGEVEVLGISLLTDPNSKVVIPESITVDKKEYIIVKIADNAFNGAYKPTSVDFSEAKYLKEIGKNAFKKSNLEEVKIPSQVRVIGEGAFEENKLKKVEIMGQARVENEVANTPMKIGRNAFANNKIVDVSFVGTEDSVRVDIGDSAFSHNKLTKLGGNADLVVGNIGNKAFWQNNFTEFKVPAKTKYIGSRAFGGRSYWDNDESIFSEFPKYNYYENNISKLTFEKFGELEEIGDEAFINHSIESVDIPSTVKIIGEKAFYAQNGMTGSHIEGKKSKGEVGANKKQFFDKIHWTYNGQDRLISYCSNWDGEDSTFRKCNCDKTDPESRIHEDDILSIENGRQVINKNEVPTGDLGLSKADQTLVDQGHDGNYLSYVNFHEVTNDETQTNVGVTKIGKAAFAYNPVKGSDPVDKRDTLYIPGSLNVVEDKIFYGNRAKVIKLDEGIKKMAGDRAFATRPEDNRYLYRVELPTTLMDYESRYAFDNNNIRRVFFRAIGGDKKVFDDGRYLSDSEDINGKAKTGFFGASPRIEYLEYPNYFDNLVANNFSNDGYKPEKPNQKSGKIRVVSYNQDAKTLSTGKNDLGNVTLELVGYQSALDSIKDADNTTVKRLNFVDIEHNIMGGLSLKDISKGSNFKYYTNIKINEYENGRVGDRIPGNEVVDKDGKNKLIEREIEITVKEKDVKSIEGRELVGVYTRKSEIEEEELSRVDLIGEENISQNAEGDYVISIPRDKYYGNEGLYLVYSATATGSLRGASLTTEVDINGIGDKSSQKETISIKDDLSASMTDKEVIDSEFNTIESKLLSYAQQGLSDSTNGAYTNVDVKILEEEVDKLAKIIEKSTELTNKQKRELTSAQKALKEDISIMGDIYNTYKKVEDLNVVNLEASKKEIENKLAALKTAVSKQSADLKIANETNIKTIEEKLKTSIEKLNGITIPESDKASITDYENRISKVAKASDIIKIEEDLKKDTSLKEDSRKILNELIENKIYNISSNNVAGLASEVSNYMEKGGQITLDQKGEILEKVAGIQSFISKLESYNSASAAKVDSKLSSVLDQLKELGVGGLDDPENTAVFKEFIDERINEINGELRRTIPDFNKVKDLQEKLTELVDKLSDEDKKEYDAKLVELTEKVEEVRKNKKDIIDVQNKINELGKLFDMAPSEDHYEIASSNAGKIKNMVDDIIASIEKLNSDKKVTRDEAEELYEYLIGDTSSKDKNLFLYYIVDTIYEGYLAELQKLKENNIKLNSVEQATHEKKLEGLYELRDRLNQVFNNSPRRDELDEINKGYDDLDLKINDIYKEIIPGVTVGSVKDESFWDVNFKRPKLKLRVLKNTKDGKGEVEVIGKSLLTEPNSKVVIPESVIIDKKEYIIVKIADNAFNGIYKPTSVDFSEAKYLKEIGKNAFKKSNLEEVKIPSQVRVIGEGAFEENKLKKVEIMGQARVENEVANTPMKIGRNAFANNKIVDVSFVGTEDSVRVDIGDSAFSHNKLTKLGGNADLVVGNIGNKAFWQNNFTEFKVPAKTKYIGSRAFGGRSYWDNDESIFSEFPKYNYYENNISKLTFEKFGELEEIGDEAFINHSIESVDIPSTVKIIGEKAFYAQNGMTGSHIEGKKSKGEVGANKKQFFDKIHWTYNGQDRLISYCSNWDGEDSTFRKCNCDKTDPESRIHEDDILSIENGRQVINEKEVPTGDLGVPKADQTLVDQGHDGNYLSYVNFHEVTNDETQTNVGVTKIGKAAFAYNPVKGSDPVDKRDTLYIPGSLNVVEDKIFYGNRAKVIKLDEGIKKMAGDRAFATRPEDNRYLYRVELPTTLMDYESRYAFDNNNIRRVFFRAIGGDKKVFDDGRYLSDSEDINGKAKTGFFGASPRIEYLEYPNYFDNLVANNFSNDGYKPEKPNQKSGKIRVVSYNQDAKTLSTGKNDLGNVTLELVGYQSALDSIKDADNTTVKRLNFVDIEHSIMGDLELGSIPAGANFKYYTNVKINEYENGRVGDRIPGNEVVDKDGKNKLIEREIEITVKEKDVKSIEGRELVGVYTRKSEIEEEELSRVDLIGEENISKNAEGDYVISIPRDKYYGNEGLYLVYSATATGSLEGVDLITEVDINGIGDKSSQKETISTKDDLGEPQTDEERIKSEIANIRQELILTAEKGIDQVEGYNQVEVDYLLDRITSLEKEIERGREIPAATRRDLEKQRKELEADANIMNDILNLAKEIESLNGITLTDEKLTAINSRIKGLESRVEAQEDDLKNSNMPNISALKELLASKQKEVEENPLPGDDKELIEEYLKQIPNISTAEQAKTLREKLKSDNRFVKEDNKKYVEDELAKKIESLIKENISELNSAIEHADELSQDTEDRLINQLDGAIDLAKELGFYNKDKSEKYLADLEIIRGKLDELGVTGPEEPGEKPEEPGKPGIKDDINTAIKDILDELNKEKPDSDKLNGLIKDLEDLISKLPKDEQKEYQDKLDKIKDLVSNLGKPGQADSIKDLLDEMIKDVIDQLVNGKPNVDNIKDLISGLKDLVSKLPEEDKDYYENIINKLEDWVNSIGSPEESDNIKDLLDEMIKDIMDQIMNGQFKPEDINDLLDKLNDLIGRLPEGDRPGYEGILDGIKDWLDNLGKPSETDKIKDLLDKMLSEVLNEMNKTNPDLEHMKDLLSKMEELLVKLPVEDQKAYKEVIKGIRDWMDNLGKPGENDKLKELIDNLIKELEKELGKDKPNVGNVQDLLDKIKDLVSKLPAEDQKEYEDAIKEIEDAIEAAKPGIKDDINTTINDILDELNKEKPDSDKLNGLIKDLEDLISKLPKDEQKEYQDKLDVIKDLVDKITKPGEKPSEEDNKIKDKIDEILEEAGKEKPNLDRLKELMKELEGLVGKLPEDKQKEYENILNKLKDMIKEIEKNNTEKPEEPGEKPEEPDLSKGYLAGYPDGTVKPNNNITREEAATIIFRLNDYDLKDVVGNTKYKDVEPGRWSERYITHLTNEGIFIGYGDGTFKPRGNMTRAEFLTAIVNMKGLELNENEPVIGFKDTHGHWAEKQISIAVREGWIRGYPNGNFMPNGKITRAEAARIINQAMSYELTEDMEVNNKFIDIVEGKWYFKDMILATGSYKYK